MLFTSTMKMMKLLYVYHYVYQRLPTTTKCRRLPASESRIQYKCISVAFIRSTSQTTLDRLQ